MTSLWLCHAGGKVTELRTASRSVYQFEAPLCHVPETNYRERRAQDAQLKGFAQELSPAGLVESAVAS